MRRRIPRPAGHYEKGERVRSVAGWAFAWILMAGVLAASVAVYGLGIGLLVWSPFAGGFFSWWFLRSGTGHRYWLRMLAAGSEEGRHVSFGNVPLTFDLTEGRILVRADGVFHCLDAPIDPEVVRRLALRYGSNGFFRRGRHWWFDEATLGHWLSTRGDRHAPADVRFRTWLDREALPGMRREMGTGSGPLDPVGPGR